MDKKRCYWAQNGTPLEKEYHDQEWWVASFDDRYLFEMLCLEWAQAGLSWRTILEKREWYRKVFDNFEIDKILLYNEEKLEKLRENPEIIRNKLKIKSVQKNARVVKKIQEEFWSFSSYIWGFTDNKQIINKWKTHKDMPVSSGLSVKISKDLKKRWASFVGEVIMYSYLQAIGVIVDHEKNCFLC